MATLGPEFHYWSYMSAKRNKAANPTKPTTPAPERSARARTWGSALVESYLKESGAPIPSSADAQAAVDLYLATGGDRQTPEFNKLWNNLQRAIDREKKLERHTMAAFQRGQEAPYIRDLKRILGRDPSAEELRLHMTNPKTPKYR